MSLGRLLLATLFRGTPPTRFYPFRVFLLRAQGFDVSPTARITASASFLVGGLSIGDETFVGHHVHAYGGPDSRIHIGARCDIGPDVCILAGTHAMSGHRRRAGAGMATTVRIGDGCWIGGRAVIVGPCTIDSGSVVAAGATVRGDVPADTLCLGPRPEDRRPLDRHPENGWAPDRGDVRA
jgi:maltose O-acetyltransferase